MTTIGGMHEHRNDSDHDPSVAKSLREYAAALGHLGWFVVACTILGEIVTLILFFWALYQSPTPSGMGPWIWLLLSAIIVAMGFIPFVAFHDQRIRYSDRLMKLKSDCESARSECKRVVAQLEESRLKERRLEQAESKLESAAAASTTDGESAGQTRLQTAVNLLLQQAKYGRDPKTKPDLRAWMTGSKELVAGIVKRSCPHRFQAGFPHGDGPMNEQDEVARQKALASLRIMATNMREDYLV